MRPVQTTAAAPQTNAHKTAASRLLIDWRERRSSGAVDSNGAAIVRSATPAKKVLPTISFGMRIRIAVPRSLPPHRCNAYGHAGCISRVHHATDAGERAKRL